MVTHQPKDRHTPEGSKLQTLNFGTETEQTKRRPGDNYLGWSPTIPKMVNHQPKDGHPPEGHKLQTRNLAL